MDAPSYQRLKSLLLQALELPAAERADFVHQHADDAAMQAQLLRLLQHEVDDGFLTDNALRLDEQDQADALIGQTIGRIRIRRLLARGGMGEVFAGVDELLQREVAVKLIRQQWQLSPQRRESFLTEARALSALQHPNICQVHDYFAAGDRDVLVLELIHGKTLRELLQATNQSRYHARLDIALQIARALVCAHEHGIAHRDLKPENVMLTEAGVVKVLDFGLARSLQVSSERAIPGADGQDNALHPPTQAGGTPGYMAPEQARGEAATMASDLWGFGALLSELLTGKAPTEPTTAERSPPDQVPPARNRPPAGLPCAETRLLRDLLRTQPAQRPSARELLLRLASIRQRRSRRLRYAAVAAVTLLLIGIGVRYTLDLRHERNQAVAARAAADAARQQAENLAGFMLEDLYTGLLGVGRLDLLEPVADQAVAYFLPEPGKPVSAKAGYSAESGFALIRAARVLEYRGRLDEAIAVAGQAVDLLQVLADEPTGNLKVSYRLAYARAELSRKLSSAGRYQEAQAQAHGAADASQRLLHDVGAAASQHQASADVSTESIWQTLLNASYSLGDSQLRAGQHEAAIATLEQAIAQAQPAVLEYPALRQQLGDLIWTRCLAYLDRSQPDGLIAACKQALELDQAAARNQPEDARSAYNLANSLWLMGEAHRKTGNAVAALPYFQQGEGIARQLIERDPAQVRNKNLLAVTLLGRAKTYAKLQQTDPMQTELEAVLDITRPLVVDSNDHLLMHNHVTALTLLARLDEARPWARKLIAAGWQRPEFLKLCAQHRLLDNCAGSAP